MKLQSHLSITMAGLLILLTACILALTVMSVSRAFERAITSQTRALQKQLIQRYQENGRSMASIAAKSLTNHVYYEDVGEIGLLTESLLAQKDVEYVYVYDAEGKVLHHRKLKYLSRPIKSILLKKEYDEDTGDSELFTQPQAEFDVVTQLDDKFASQSLSAPFDFFYANHLIINQPIQLGEKVIGGIMMALNIDFITNNTKALFSSAHESLVQGKNEGIKHSLLISSGVVFISIVVMLLISRRIARPLIELTSALPKIGEGDYTVKLDTKRTDEVGDLVLAYKNMLDKLERTTMSRDEFQRLADQDFLTGLPNRRCFFKHAEAIIEFAQEKDVSLAVVVLDLNNFKPINDTYGHDVGDVLLKEVAKRLNQCIRFDDLITRDDQRLNMPGRLGGDEFTLLLANLARDNYTNVLDRILDTMTEPYSLNGLELQVGVSLGVAFFPEDGSDFETLLHNADEAMYRSKAAGDSQFTPF